MIHSQKAIKIDEDPRKSFVKHSDPSELGEKKRQ
jgi:hypothetical protein